MGQQKPKSKIDTSERDDDLLDFAIGSVQHESNPLEFNFDPFAGSFYKRTATSPPKEIFDLEGVIGQLDSGARTDVSDGVITYGFFVGNHAVGLNNNPHFGEGKGYSPFSAEQKAAAINAVALWDELIPQTFVNVGDVTVKDWAQNSPDIILANTTTGPAQAWAYYPGYGQQYTRVSSDVWIADPAANWSNNWFDLGGYGNTTLIHELGHSIGLSHPGAYNGAGATTYDNQAEYAQDSMQYTIMSYWSGSNTRALTVNWSVFLNNYAQTPMLHDILAIQSMYGVDTTTRTGDTTYGFNSNAGHSVFDFSQNPYPYLAVWDAGGIDTIDLSGFTASQFLNLQAGSFSSIGAAIPDAATINANTHAFNEAYGTAFSDVSQATVNAVGGSYMNAAEARIEAYTGVDGIYATAHDNFAIAYGVTIENGTGGSGNDLIWGNEVANILKGLDGDDVLVGFDGDDTIVGGAGADELTGGDGDDVFVFDTLNDLGNLITDFEAGDLLDFGQLNIDLTYIGDSGFSGTAGELRYDGGVLSGDFDGNGVADFSVALAGAPSLQPDQIVAI